MHRFARWSAPGLAAALLVGLVGCANNSTPSARGTVDRSASSTAGSDQPGTAAAVPLKAVTWAGYQDTIKSLKGKVVVADFWQTT